MLQVIELADGLYGLGEVTKVLVRTTRKIVQHPSAKGRKVVHQNKVWNTVVTPSGTKTWKTRKGASNALEALVAKSQED